MRRLFIRPGGIGDCITWLPVLERCVSEYTEVWVPSAVVPLVASADRVRPIGSTGIDLVGIGGEAPASLRDSLDSFDEVWSWYGTNRSEFRQEVEQYNPSWRFFRALPPPDCVQHVTDFYATQCGLDCNLQPSIVTGEVEPRQTVVIHPFSGGQTKNWPLERFQELAARLNLPVEWLAGPSEALPGAKRFDNLLDLAQWVRGAMLYVGNDSGITHLAAATGVPTVGLYSESKAKVWRARGPSMHVIAGESVQDVSIGDVARVIAILLYDSRSLNDFSNALL